MYPQKESLTLLLVCMDLLQNTNSAFKASVPRSPYEVVRFTTVLVFHTNFIIFQEIHYIY